VDEQGNPGISGISVQSADGLNGVSFSVFADFSVNVAVTVNGMQQPWQRVGIAAPFMHRGGPEMLWHTYNIQLDADGTFTVLLDGNVLRSGISAGPASAWADGIGSGTLFTLSSLDSRHLSTSFDNVRVFGLADAPHTPAGTANSPEALTAGIASPALADTGLSTGATNVHQVAAVESVGASSPADEATATARALAWAPIVAADPLGGASVGHRLGGESGHLTSPHWEILVSPWWTLPDLNP
jgi:hypothetical protein